MCYGESRLGTNQTLRINRMSMQTSAAVVIRDDALGVDLRATRLVGAQRMLVEVTACGMRVIEAPAEKPSAKEIRAALDVLERAQE